MSNIIEQYRKPLASDETGKAIADKLDGKTVEVETRNISEQYRQPLMTEETARTILEKIDGGSGDDNTIIVTFTETEPQSVEYNCDYSIDEIIEQYQAGKYIYGIVSDGSIFGGNRLSIINASNTAIQDGQSGDAEKGVTFGNIVYSIGRGLYFDGICGRVVDNEDNWEFNSFTWDNS